MYFKESKVSKYCMKFPNGMLTEVNGDTVEQAIRSAEEVALKSKEEGLLRIIEIKSDAIVASRNNSNEEWELYDE